MKEYDGLQLETNAIDFLYEYMAYWKVYMIFVDAYWHLCYKASCSNALIINMGWQCWPTFYGNQLQMSLICAGTLCHIIDNKNKSL